MSIVYCSLERRYDTSCEDDPRSCTSRLLLKNGDFGCGENQRVYLPNLEFGIKRLPGSTNDAGDLVDDYIISIYTKEPPSSINFPFRITYGAVPVGEFMGNVYGASFVKGATGPKRYSYPNANASVVKITPSLIPASILDPAFYNQTDEYEFNVAYGLLRSAYLGLIRNPALSIATTNMMINSSINPLVIDSSITAKSCLSCKKKCECIEVPEVLANIQTTIDGSDINQAIFTILDKYTYYEETPLIRKCSSNEMIRCETKETRFDKCCPFIVSVVRGKGETLQKKLEYIWTKYPPDIRFENFYSNVIVFAMSRYIFARILYGCFSIDLILGRYYDEFLIDLGKSRFCRFVSFFTEGYIKGYNKYIKY